jgi:cell division septal protein FtsQ
MAAKKKPVKRKTPVTAPKRRRTASTAGRKTKSGTGKIANYVVPLFFIACIVVCLGFLGVMGYRTATASEFFDVKKIDVRGVSRRS